MSFCRQGSPKNLKNSVTKFSLTELPILRMPSCRSLFLSLFYPHSTFHPISHFYMPNDVCLTSPSRGHFSFYNPLSTTYLFLSAILYWKSEKRKFRLPLFCGTTLKQRLNTNKYNPSWKTLKPGYVIKAPCTRNNN